MTDEQLDALLKTLESYGQDVPVDQSLRLVREDGAWKICQDELDGACVVLSQRTPRSRARERVFCLPTDRVDCDACPRIGSSCAARANTTSRTSTSPSPVTAWS